MLSNTESLVVNVPLSIDLLVNVHGVPVRLIVERDSRLLYDMRNFHSFFVKIGTYGRIPVTVDIHNYELDGRKCTAYEHLNLRIPQLRAPMGVPSKAAVLLSRTT